MDRGGRGREVGVQANPDSSEHQATGRGAAEALVVLPWSSCQEKPLASISVCDGPYRKPPQVGRGKRLKVDERSSVKELGKLAP